MKKIFVHCWIKPGGALNVLIDLIEQNKGIDRIYTLHSDRKVLQINKKKIEIRPVIPFVVHRIFEYFEHHHIFILSSIFDYRNWMFFYPLLMRFMSFMIKRYKPDHIYISSFSIAKNIKFADKKYRGKYKPYLWLYLHSPMQYIWDQYDEYHNKLEGYKKKLFEIIVNKQRAWDKKFVKYNQVYANSLYTKELAEKIYGMENIKIKYPKVDDVFYKTQPYSKNKIQDYFVFVGRISKFMKELDLIIDLFNYTGDNLLIIGSGPDEEEMKMKAKKNISFAGWISDPKEKMEMIAKSRGFVNFARESFGIVTAEALLLGVPVFGYGKRCATAELVDKYSGVLVSSKKLDTLIEEFEKFKKMKFDRAIIKNNIIKLLGR